MQRLTLFIAALSLAALGLACERPQSSEPAQQPAPTAHPPESVSTPQTQPAPSAQKKTPVVTPHQKTPSKALKPVTITGPQPQIASKAPEFNYGTVVPGAEVKHTFTVHNAGEKPLTIKRTEAG